MLQIEIPSTEQWDEANECFVQTKGHSLTLEHSLVSISKWESKWGKPFFSNQEKTLEEMTDYVRCMTITQNIDPNVYGLLTNDNLSDIRCYIDASMTATKINENSGKKSNDIITSEIIYYWMITLNIPFECQKWHLNRLLTLIRVCSIKNKPKKKMSRREVMSRNAALNAARRKKLNSSG